MTTRFPRRIPLQPARATAPAVHTKGPGRSGDVPNPARRAKPVGKVRGDKTVADVIVENRE